MGIWIAVFGEFSHLHSISSKICFDSVMIITYNMCFESPSLSNLVIPLAVKYPYRQTVTCFDVHKVVHFDYTFDNPMYMIYHQLSEIFAVMISP